MSGLIILLATLLITLALGMMVYLLSALSRPLGYPRPTLQLAILCAITLLFFTGITLSTLQFSGPLYLRAIPWLFVTLVNGLIISMLLKTGYLKGLILFLLSSIPAGLAFYLGVLAMKATFTAQLR